MGSALLEKTARPAQNWPTPEILVKGKWIPDDLTVRLRDYNPRTEFGRIVKDCFGHLPPEQAGALLDQISRIVVLESSLAIVVYRGQEGDPDRRIEDYGIVSRKVITTVGVNFLVDAWQNSVEMENMRYHGFGSGTSAEAVGNTALVTEFTTQYATDNVRPTGSLTEGASANIFRSVGTFTPNSGGTFAVEEHGLFDQAATGGGVLWDRSLTGTQTLTANQDSLEATYDATISSGG